MDKLIDKLDTKTKKNGGHVRRSPPKSYSVVQPFVLFWLRLPQQHCAFVNITPDNSPLIMFFFIQYL